MYSTKISEVLKLLIVLLHRQAESRGIGVIGAVNVFFFLSSWLLIFAAIVYSGLY